MDRNHIQIIHNGRLSSISSRQDDPFEFFLACLYRHGQTAFDRQQASVKRELPHDNVLVKLLQFNLIARRQDADRKAKVVGRTLLAHIGRCEVDGDTSAWPFQSSMADCCCDTFLAFPYGIVGQAYHDKAKWKAQIHFHRNCESVYALHGAPKGFY